MPVSARSIRIANCSPARCQAAGYLLLHDRFLATSELAWRARRMWLLPSSLVVHGRPARWAVTSGHADIGTVLSGDTVKRGSILVQPQRFTVAVVTAGNGRVRIPVPFDPDVVWGIKPRHHIAGTMNGMGVRGVIEPSTAGFGFIMGPAWLRDCGISTGDIVTVEINAEGPQRGDLAEDIASALDASPQAGAFFDSLAQFYRRAYLRWIDATKRRPEQRPQRIAEMIQLLEAGQKQRPGQ